MDLKLLPGEISRREWNDIVVTFRDQNFYQFWEWAEARRAVGWQVRRFVLERHGRIVAAAQGLIRRLPLLPWGYLRVRGGPLVDAPHGREMEALGEILDGIRGRFPAAVIRVSPDHPAGDGIEGALGASGFERPHRQRPEQTFRLDLEPDLGVLRRRLSPSWRRNLARAERNRLAVRPIATVEDLRRFFELHAETRLRKGFRDHLSWGLLHELWRVSSIRSGIRGFLALEGQQAVAGRVVGLLGLEALDLFAATSPRGRETGASYLLLWEAIRTAKARGGSRFDLGGVDPARNPGVFDFKRGLGGDLVQRVGHWTIYPGRAIRWLFDAVIEPRL